MCNQWLWLFPNKIYIKNNKKVKEKKKEVETEFMPIYGDELSD